MKKETKDYNGCIRLTKRQYDMACEVAKIRGEQRGEVMTLSELFRTLVIEEFLKNENKNN